MFKKTLMTTALALTLNTSAYAASYQIDVEGAHASINFEASHLGYSVLTGRFDKFEGTFEYDAEKPEAGSVSVEIDMDSVNSNHGERDNHLRGDKIFDVASNPTATFVSTGVKMIDEKTANMTGDLTIRGETKSVELHTVFIGEGKDPWGGYRVGFTAHTTIQLADFGMDGLIGDAPIKLTIQVEGVRK